jgi:hypothetical protein
MRFIPTRVHGVLDYLWGASLVSSPWLLGQARGGAETWIPVAFGAGAGVYSLLTDYELGAAPVLPMRTHLTIDVLGGLLLAATPWIFGLGREARALHLGFGLFSVAAGLMTRTEPRRHAAIRA